MLSSRKRLEQRQGKHGTPRHEYLQQLVHEYQRTPQALRKEEIVANLANFAYDPINYASIQQLSIVDLFVDILDMAQSSTAAASSEGHEQQAQRRRSGTDAAQASQQRLVEFALGGLCNCLPDPRLQAAFLDSDAAPLVLAYVLDIDTKTSLEGKHNECARNTALSALTICYHLLDSPAFAAMTDEHVAECMRGLCSHPDVQVANLAAVFLSRVEEILQQVDSHAVP
ncbi:TPA: hypothetical protein N0F65_010901 [Lagenidium giganteum]|uniref:Armadillo repeat-containing protein 7 n=1 Tax=Lagenidium giganteum TaxID=4803 RepID=A0AAV2YD04_9STRA|nr:TPA: hypothetical protein N0F65_010901 [Lagenidium giganteum]